MSLALPLSSWPSPKRTGFVVLPSDSPLVLLRFWLALAPAVRLKKCHLRRLSHASQRHFFDGVSGGPLLLPRHLLLLS